MKKYFILAAAAIVALAACTKMEVANTPDTAKKISFEVANYVPQTKSTTNGSLVGEGVYKFHTVAYQTPEIGNPVKFMDDDVLAYNNSSVVTSGTTVTSWAPSLDYYWPKTGYISFYSYAGTLAGTAVEGSAASAFASSESPFTTVVLNFGSKTIDENDNLMVADAALHYNGVNSNSYSVDNNGSGSDVTTGVPTLFHHMLSRLSIDVKAKTNATVNANSTTTWKVKVLGSQAIGGNTYKSAVYPVKKGSLRMQHSDNYSGSVNGYTIGSIAWTFPDVTENDNSVNGWIPATGSGITEEIQLDYGDNDPLSINIKTDAGRTSASTVTLLAERTVMPQLAGNVKFVLVYEVAAYHDGEDTPFMQEIRYVGIDLVDDAVDETKDLVDLASSITSWEANKKYIYHIVIDPVTNKVTFDPAVVGWETPSIENGTDINVNNSGII